MSLKLKGPRRCVSFFRNKGAYYHASGLFIQTACRNHVKFNNACCWSHPFENVIYCHPIMHTGQQGWPNTACIRFSFHTVLKKWQFSWLRPKYGVPLLQSFQELHGSLFITLLSFSDISMGGLILSGTTSPLSWMATVLVNVHLVFINLII